MNRAFAACAVALLPVLSGCAEPSSAPAAAQLMPVPSARSACLTLGAPNQPNNEPRAINDRGEIVGNDGTGSYLIRPPYRRQDQTRENYPGGVSTTVTSLDDAEALVGYYRNAAGETRSFLKAHGVWVSYGNPTGRETVEVLGINDKDTTVGAFVGKSREHAFDGRSRLHPPGALDSSANAIDARGDVVGSVTLRSSRESLGLLYRAGAYRELQYPGAASTAFYAISRNRTIVGAYTDSEGKTHGLIRSGTSERDALWQSFDYSGAHGLTVLTGVNARGELTGYFRSGKSLRGFLCR
jgi:uncharacterized membrane protein